MIAHQRLRGRAARPVLSRRERGAVVVELAFVAVFLITMAAGAFDYGMAWRSSLAVTEGARTGARVGSSQGVSVNADFSLLSGTRAALSSSGLLSSVTRVVIFRSDTVDGAIPANCRTTSSATTSDPCNILTGDQFRALPTSVGTGTLTATGCITNSQTKSWCPTTRNNVQITAQYLGVWVQVLYRYEFRLLGTTRTIERTAVMRLEPSEG